jgi:hypothetical protein
MAGVLGFLKYPIMQAGYDLQKYSAIGMETQDTLVRGTKMEYNIF